MEVFWTTYQAARRLRAVDLGLVGEGIPGLHMLHMGLVMEPLVGVSENVGCNGDSLPGGAGEIMVDEVCGALSVMLTIKKEFRYQLVTLSFSHYHCGLARLQPGVALRRQGQIWVFALSSVRIRSGLDGNSLYSYR